jgi:hypothetical protein
MLSAGTSDDIKDAVGTRLADPIETASAMFAFGRLVIASPDSTCTMFSAVR